MLLPNTHRHALHTGSSAPGFHCDADPNPKQVLRTVHTEKEVLRDLAFSALRIRRAICFPPLFFYLVLLFTCWNQLVYAVIWALHLLIHQWEAKPGKTQKCCRTVGTRRDPSELIQQRNRAHCTVQLANESLWGVQFYCHYSAITSALISPPYSKAFYRIRLIWVGQGTRELGNHPCFGRTHSTTGEGQQRRGRGT